jgi:hypothetical protein
MNERIRLLAEQAFFDENTNQPSDKMYTFTEHKMKQFAELIVRECMACSTWVGKMNTNTVEPVHTAHAINQRIKQQFGVEE